MNSRNLLATGVFCDDVRMEADGRATILGVMADNIAVSGFPGVIPKLGLYARIIFDPNDPPFGLSVKLISSSQEDPLMVASIDQDLIDQATLEALNSENEIAGTVVTAVAAQFVLDSAVRLKLVLESPEESFTIGYLRVESIEVAQAELGTSIP